MANVKTIYKTANGKEIDLNKLINQNELTMAVGNKKVNARGDLIGPGGQIIKKQEDIMNGITIPDQIRKQQVKEDTTTEIEIIDQKQKQLKKSSIEGDE